MLYSESEARQSFDSLYQPCTAGRIWIRVKRDGFHIREIFVANVLFLTTILSGHYDELKVIWLQWKNRNFIFAHNGWRVLYNGNSSDQAAARKETPRTERWKSSTALQSFCESLFYAAYCADLLAVSFGCQGKWQREGPDYWKSVHWGLTALSVKTQ